MSFASIRRNNLLGPLGASALARGHEDGASRLETLTISSCSLGNNGVVGLVPTGQVSRFLTKLNLRAPNDIEGTAGGENILALASVCTNLDDISVGEHVLSPDQHRRMELLLDRKRLCTAVQVLAGSPCSVLFRFVEEQAHRVEHALSAIPVILQNEGDIHFCTANNRALE
jgi:hypothetical protein